MFVRSVDILKIFTVILVQKSPYQTVEGSVIQATATTIIKIGIKDPLSQKYARYYTCTTTLARSETSPRQPKRRQLFLL